MSDEQQQDSAFARQLAERLGGAAQRAGFDPHASNLRDATWKATGGWRGIIESVLPSLIFVVIYVLTIDGDSQKGNLWLSLGISVGLAAVFTVIRLVTRSQATAAIGGLFAAVVSAVLALWTGRASDNFLFGIILNAGYALALLISLLVRWPVIGLIGGWLMGDGFRWRQSRRKMRTYLWLTVMWMLLFVVRLAVEVPLYLADNAAVLGLAKLALGIPLFAPLAAVSWLVARAGYRGTKHQEGSSESEQASGAAQ